MEYMYCAPYMIPWTTEPLGTACGQDFVSSNNEVYLAPGFDARTLLSNPVWIDYDVYKGGMATLDQNITTSPKKPSPNDVSASSPNDPGIGATFADKYSHIPQEDDARSIALNWTSEVQRAILHLNPRSISRRLLHIGSDANREPGLFHTIADSVVLVDIAERLLEQASRASDVPPEKCAS